MTICVTWDMGTTIDRLDTHFINECDRFSSILENIQFQRYFRKRIVLLSHTEISECSLCTKLIRYDVCHSNMIRPGSKIRNAFSKNCQSLAKIAKEVQTFSIFSDFSTISVTRSNFLGFMRPFWNFLIWCRIYKVIDHPMISTSTKCFHCN